MYIVVLTKPTALWAAYDLLGTNHQGTWDVDGRDEDQYNGQHAELSTPSSV